MGYQKRNSRYHITVCDSWSQNSSIVSSYNKEKRNCICRFLLEIYLFLSEKGKSGESASCIIPNKDKNQIFQERVEPCHLSSSLYYGGQDIYSNCSSTQTSASYPAVSHYYLFMHTTTITDNWHDNWMGFNI